MSSKSSSAIIEYVTHILFSDGTSLVYLKYNVMKSFSINNEVRMKRY